MHCLLDKIGKWDSDIQIIVCHIQKQGQKYFCCIYSQSQYYFESMGLIHVSVCSYCTDPVNIPNTGTYDVTDLAGIDNVLLL